MRKSLGSWSGMRKFLEQEMLADSLKGRIRYNCTTYVGMDGCKIFEIFIDNALVKQFSWETVNTYFIQSGVVDKQNTSQAGVQGYWADFWKTFDNTPMENRTEYTDEEFCDALKEYRNQDISESIKSSNPIVRMFAILDRRLGKRTLENLKNNESTNPLWLEKFYELRFTAEKIG